MLMTLETLQAEMMRLPQTDRARLLDRLIASLDVDQEAEAAWDALADRREAELEAGDLRSVPLEEVLAKLEARYSK